ncbi:MAG: hypothetical protein ACI9KE_000604 [Polyangiales bacterium]|jgi:hypothetical protein
MIPAVYWEAGAVGKRTNVRAVRRADGYVLNTFDTGILGTNSCLQGSSSWSDFVDDCTSHDNGAVGLQTSGFVPNVSVGRVGCMHTAQDACSPCGIDLPSTSPTSPRELYQPNLDIEHPDAGYRLDSGSMFNTGTSAHTQGVARLRDLIVQFNPDGSQTRVGRVIHTDNAFDSGLTYYEQNVKTGACGLYDTVYYTSVDPERQYRQNIRGDYGHPSGVQAHGDYVVLALEDYDKETASDSAAFDIDLPPGVTPAADGAAVFFLHYAPTPGAVGTHPYEPDCFADEDGDDLSDCYGGAAGMALLTDCSGAVYLWIANGSSSSGADYQWWQVYRVLQNTAGVVQIFQNSWQRDYVGLVSTNNPGFRWSGGAYISTLQRPVLFNTERGTNEGDNDYIDGHVYYRAPSCGLRGGGSEAPEARPPLADPDSLPGDRVPRDMSNGGTPRWDQRVAQERLTLESE